MRPEDNRKKVSHLQLLVLRIFQAEQLIAIDLVQVKCNMQARQVHRESRKHQQQHNTALTTYNPTKLNKVAIHDRSFHEYQIQVTA